MCLEAGGVAPHIILSTLLRECKHRGACVASMNYVKIKFLFVASFLLFCEISGIHGKGHFLFEPLVAAKSIKTIRTIGFLWLVACVLAWFLWRASRTVHCFVRCSRICGCDLDVWINSKKSNKNTHCRFSWARRFCPRIILMTRIAHRAFVCIVLSHIWVWPRCLRKL